MGLIQWVSGVLLHSRAPADWNLFYTPIHQTLAPESSMDTSSTLDCQALPLCEGHFTLWTAAHLCLWPLLFHLQNMYFVAFSFICCQDQCHWLSIFSLKHHATHINNFFYFSIGHCYFVYELEHNFSSSYRVRRLSFSVPFHLILSPSVPCSVPCSHLHVEFHMKPHFFKLPIFTSSSSALPVPLSWHQVCGCPAAPSPTDLPL